MTASIRVQPLDVMTEAEWPFRLGAPEFRHRVHGGGSVFDPFPAYPHDLHEVERAASHVARCCPPLWEVDLFIANREETGRSNGHSNVHEGGHYEGNEWVHDTPTGLIMLSGKRVPPHPAMTRYLVAHEYGHNVEWMIAHRRRLALHGNALMLEYAEMRGLPATAVHHGHGGQWHDSVTEIFACDFRIVVCDVEVEFWPHPGIDRPCPTVADWWAQALDDLTKQPSEIGAAT